MPTRPITRSEIIRPKSIIYPSHHIERFFFSGFYNKHERLVQNTALQRKLQIVKDVDFTIVDRDIVWKLGESLCPIFLFTFIQTCAR